MELDLPYPYLNSEDEREDAASLLMEKFQLETTGIFCISFSELENPDALDDIKKYLNFKITLDRIDVSEDLTKIKAFTKQLEVNYDNMFLFSSVIYDLVLAFDLRINGVDLESS